MGMYHLPLWVTKPHTSYGLAYLVPTECMYLFVYLRGALEGYHIKKVLAFWVLEVNLAR